MRPVILAVTVALGCAWAAHGELPQRAFTADVVIRSEGNTVVVAAAIDRDPTAIPRTRDDVNAHSRQLFVDEIFTFQSESTVPALRERWAHAHVEFSNQSLIIIHAPSSQALMLHLSDAAQDRREYPAGFDVTRIPDGFELSEQPVHSGWALTLDRVEIDPAAASRPRLGVSPDVSDGPLINDPGDGSGGYVSCPSGGVGSTSCSSGTGNCSVTCSAGYYACCTANGCKCYKNP